MLDFYIKVY